MTAFTGLSQMSDARQRPVERRIPWSTLGLCGAGFALTTAAVYPGILSDDAVDQFGQGLRFHFTDWHPPIMALWWWVLDHVWAGPQPMLLLQTGFYWLAVALLLWAAPLPANRLVRWGMVAAFVSPAILNFLGVVEKDTQLAVCWSLVTAYCYARRSGGVEPGWIEKAALLVLVAYGALLRQNSALVAGPVVLYLVTGRAMASRLWRTLALYLATALAFTALSATLNRALQAEPTHVMRGLIDFDLAGISLHSGSSVFPFPVDEAEMHRVVTCYDGGSGHDKLVWGDCSFIWQRDLATPLSDGQYITAWVSAIAQHPAAYLAHRLTYYALFSGLATLRPTHGFWNDGTGPNNFGFVTHHHPLFLALKAWTYAGLATPFLRPGFWLIASFALAWFARRTGIDRATRDFATAAGTASGVYLLTYLPFGLAPDFRYAYPSILLTTFGACAVAAIRARRQDQIIAPTPHV